MLELCLLLVYVMTAQPSPCDPELLTADDRPLSYKLRDGGRCEGLYVGKVAGNVLSLGSFTESFAAYDPKSVEYLIIEWSQPGAEEVHLRARGLRPHLYYRMDKVVPGTEKLFQWPADIISELEVPPGELGVVGWIRTESGGAVRDVYVPLRVGPGRGEDSEPRVPPRLVLVPTAELSEVYVTLEMMAGEGRPAVYLRDGEPLEYGYYPPGYGTVILLSELETTGFFRLEIGATIRGGGISHLEIWLYYRE